MQLSYSVHRCGSAYDRGASGSNQTKVRATFGSIALLLPSDLVTSQARLEVLMGGKAAEVRYWVSAAARSIDLEKPCAWKGFLSAAALVDKDLWL